jgi:hypothetical protein
MMLFQQKRIESIVKTVLNCSEGEMWVKTVVFTSHTILEFDVKEIRKLLTELETIFWFSFHFCFFSVRLE